MFLGKFKKRLLAGKILRQAIKDEHLYSSKRGLSYCGSIWDRFDEMEKKEERLKKIARFPDTRRVLKSHHKIPDDIWHIYKDLLSSNVGIFNSALIIIKPEYLNLYLDKKEEGLSESDLGIFLIRNIKELV